MSKEAGPEHITITYDGGLATNGQMLFYEYSRATYAVARMVSTIELFRRTGRVAARISSRNYVPLVIRAPEKGSFPVDVIIPTVVEVTKVIHEYNIPVGVFIKYVLSTVKRLIPKSEDLVLALAKLEVDKMDRQVSLSREETARIAEIRKMVEAQSVSTNTAIGVLEGALKSPDRRILELGGTQAQLNEIIRELKDRNVAEAELEPYAESLRQIDEARLVKLTSKVRPQLAEIGLPLRSGKSATSVAISTQGREFVRFDEESIQDLNSRELDQTETVAAVRMFAYDKDAGYGKCDIPELNIFRVGFVVPVTIRTIIRRKILDAIDQNAVSVSFRFFRDKSGTPTSLLLSKVFV